MKHWPHWPEERRECTRNVSVLVTGDDQGRVFRMDDVEEGHSKDRMEATSAGGLAVDDAQQAEGPKRG